MELHEACRAILQELGEALGGVDEQAAEALAGEIGSAKRVFLAGAGRSGLAVKAFAMRLMHLGCEVFVAGETVTPGLQKGDLLLIGSGSGGTGSLVVMAQRAKDIGARLALVTIEADSPIGRLADVVVTIPAPTPKLPKAGGPSSIQPMGSLFEQAQLLFYDALVLRLMEKRGMGADEMFGRHANLE